MENNTQLKEMIRSMVIDVLQGQSKKQPHRNLLNKHPRGQEPGVFDTVDEAIPAAKRSAIAF